MVSYGGISGGLRAAPELRQLIGNVGMIALPETVPLPLAFGHLEGEGDQQPLNATEPMAKGAHGMLDELAKWAGALKPLRG